MPPTLLGAAVRCLHACFCFLITAKSPYEKWAVRCLHVGGMHAIEGMPARASIEEEEGKEEACQKSKQRARRQLSLHLLSGLLMLLRYHRHSFDEELLLSPADAAHL